jgi:predicted dehydrogenase
VSKPRIAVIGAGQFGRNHVRVAANCADAELTAVIDLSPARAREAIQAAGVDSAAQVFTDYREAIGRAQAAIIAAPTSEHVGIGCVLMEAGLDVLVEKPVAASLGGADLLIRTAEKTGRILQVGHLERFNPIVQALERESTLPLFFEIHRMNAFSPRSLDVDVVLDLMIHDIDIVLNLAGESPAEIHAAGVSILSEKVDIANVRLSFSSGCVANLTASRVSTERIRKLRLFQPGEYISLDYTRQHAVRFRVTADRQIGFQELACAKAEPLQAQFAAFLESVQTRKEPKLNGISARRTLETALGILDKIEVHSGVVARTLERWKQQHSGIDRS